MGRPSKAVNKIGDDDENSELNRNYKPESASGLTDGGASGKLLLSTFSSIGLERPCSISLGRFDRKRRVPCQNQ